MSIFQKMKFNALKKKAFAYYQARQAEEGTDEDIKKEIAVYLELAKFYKKHLFDKNMSKAETFLIESYRAAASLGDVHARYILSEILFEKAKFWESLKESMYSNKVHGKYAKDAYEEAFVYLKAAEEAGHALAKRLHGLAYVNGWGVEKDQERGFQLVVDSIDQEDAWDRATKIFEKIGLNKPEFFTSIMSLKNKSKK